MTVPSGGQIGQIGRWRVDSSRSGPRLRPDGEVVAGGCRWWGWWEVLRGKERSCKGKLTLTTRGLAQVLSWSSSWGTPVGGSHDATLPPMHTRPSKRPGTVVCHMCVRMCRYITSTLTAPNLPSPQILDAPAFILLHPHPTLDCLTLDQAVGKSLLDSSTWASTFGSPSSGVRQTTLPMKMTPRPAAAPSTTPRGMSSPMPLRATRLFLLAWTS